MKTITLKDVDRMIVENINNFKNLSDYRKSKALQQEKKSKTLRQEAIKFYKKNFDFLKFIGTIKSFEIFKKIVLSDKKLVKNWLITDDLADIIENYSNYSYDRIMRWSKKTIIQRWFEVVRDNWKKNILYIPDGLEVGKMLMVYFGFENEDSEDIYWSFDELIDEMETDDDLEENDKENLFLYFKK